jgi:hypothetical protein
MSVRNKFQYIGSLFEGLSGGLCYLNSLPAEISILHRGFMFAFDYRRADLSAYHLT